MSQRTKYQQEIDQLQVPKEKAEETLRLMLEKNKELRAQDAKKTPARKRAPYFALAAAAVFALVFFGARQLSPQGGLPGVHISDLPPVAYARGDDSEAVSFLEAFQTAPDSLFPGWQAEVEAVNAYILNGETRHEARLALTRQERHMSASVLDIEPPLWTALNRGDGQSLYLARDTDTEALWAAGYREGLYFVLTAEDASEDEFTAWAREIVAP